MSIRRVVLTVAVAVLLLAPLGAAPAVAKKAPPANKQVARAFALLIKDTRQTPKRAVKKSRRAALVKTAKRARAQSRRRPCAAIKTLRSYRRGLRGVRV
jgi:hypothetical protein